MQPVPAVNKRETGRDAPISVGDLVQVVRAGCCEDHTGKVGKVEHAYSGAGNCPSCGADHLGAPSVLLDGIPRAGFRISWLKRIPPLSELEGEKREEETHV